MKTVLRLVLAGLTTLAASPVIAIAGASEDRLEVTTFRRVTDTSFLPEGCGDPNGEAIIDSEVEVHLAVNPANPDHLLASWQQDRYGTGGAARTNAVAVSRDGGLTWTPPAGIPGISGCTSEASPFDRSTDPWGAIGPDGTAYLSTLSVNNNAAPSEDDAVLASTSPDGGETWLDDPAVLAAGTHYLEKPAIAADPVHPGRAYIVWRPEEQEVITRENLDSHMEFAMTEDGGLTWSDAVLVPPDDNIDWEQPLQIVPASRDDGGTTLYLFYWGMGKTTRGLPGIGPATVSVVRSDDLGATWSEPSLAASYLMNMVRGDPAGLATIDPGVPSVAISAAGTLYVAWSEDTLQGPAPGGSDVKVARSDDEGVTWTTDTVASVANAAFLPTIAVAGDGTVGISWYDLRNDVQDDPDDELTTDVWFASSRAGVGPWEEIHIAGSFDLRKGPRDGGGSRHFLGDYAGMVGLPRGFGLLFPVTPPDATGGSSDVFFARVEQPEGEDGALKVTGSGTVPGEGGAGEGRFDLAAHKSASGSLKGNVLYEDMPAGVSIETTSIETLTVGKDQGVLTCRMTGWASVVRDGTTTKERLTISCADAGWRGTGDALRIETDSYSGGGSLRSGNLRIHR